MRTRAEPPRRPSGDIGPLPRPIYPSGRVYIAGTVALAASWLLVALVPPAGAVFDAFDEAVLDAMAELRAEPMRDIAGAVGVLGSHWLWRTLRWATIAIALAIGQVRQLVVYGALLLTATAATAAWVDTARPVAALGLSSVGAMYTLVPRGRRRNRAKVVTGLAMAVLVASRLYRGLDAPTDQLAALILGMAAPVVVFRFAAPHDVFPIVYGRRRGRPELAIVHERAIGDAVQRELGWLVQSVTPERPPGSAGSTPMTLTVRRGDGEPAALFAKLYSLANLRADRWYKLGRAIRYGRLEDEAPFASIRHLVEHEDYALRLAADAGLPVPASFGFVELTRNRDYLLVLQMLPGARQLGPDTVTVDIVDQGIEIVRQLRAAGLAHRDIKPANLAISDGRLHLVDLSFVEVRPTPWRQSVDLATMMLSLGLFIDPELVYERARRAFSDGEIAEAFASAGSVTIPAQLRSLMRTRSPGIVLRFRAMGPRKPTVAMQRWSIQRFLLTAAVAGGAVVATLLLVYNLDSTGLL